MCIATNCSWSFVYWVIVLECIFVTSCVLFYYVGTAVLHTLVAGLLAEICSRKVLRTATRIKFLRFLFHIHVLAL